MAYTSGGVISTSDYNGFAGGTTANVSGELNTVLSTGKGNAGYGQTSVANVSLGAIVTATQWTTMVNAINVVRKHQAGAGFSNLSTYTAGANINASQNISSNLTTAYSNRQNYQAQGTTTTGSTFSSNFTAVADTLEKTFSWSRTATFASADQARYFFNAGGQLNFVVISVTNNNGTLRSGDLGNLTANYFQSKKIGGPNSVAHTGTGGTVNSDLTTNYGYYGQTTANTILCQITGASYAAYALDTIKFYGKTNGAQGSNSDNGSNLTMSVDLVAAAQSPATAGDAINITVNHRVDVIYPSTTFLSNTWGSVTIT